MTFPMDPEFIKRYRSYLLKRIESMNNEQSDPPKVMVNGVWVNFSDLNEEERQAFLRNLGVVQEALTTTAADTPRVPAEVAAPLPASGVASTMATTAPAPAPVETVPAQLIEFIPCDIRDCGHRSYIRATLNSGNLYFCGHHGHEKAATLKPKSLAWLDETDRLGGKLDVSA